MAAASMQLASEANRMVADCRPVYAAPRERGPIHQKTVKIPGQAGMVGEVCGQAHD
jgi:hypothetical protein